MGGACGVRAHDPGPLPLNSRQPAGARRASAAESRTWRGSVRLRTLGGFRCESDGIEIPFGSGSGLAAMLLVYLATVRRANTPELQEIFFPESTTCDAEHALRTTCGRIARMVERPWVQRSGDHWMADACVECDACEFHEAIRAGEYAGAAGLYCGPFLRGAAIGITPRLEKWVAGVRGQASEAFILASHRLALLRTADALGHGAAFMDTEGRVIAENGAYQSLTRRAPGLEEALRAWLGGPDRGQADAASTPLRTRVIAGGIVFEAAAEAVVSGVKEPASMLVGVRPSAQIEGESCPAPSAATLTAAQRRVARLLAVGLANKEIAERLGLSRHTVRHHTESVLARLSVRSRAGVAAALSGIRPDSEPVRRGSVHRADCGADASRDGRSLRS